MTIRTFYRVALSGPLLGLAIAILLRRMIDTDSTGAERLLLPGSLTRGLIAYSVVAVWLWIELGRRAEPATRPLVWRAPLLYLAANWLLVIGLTAAQGRLGALWPGYAGLILLRTIVHLVVGYGYVALVHVARSRLEASGVLARSAAT